MSSNNPQIYMISHLTNIFATSPINNMTSMCATNVVMPMNLNLSSKLTFLVSCDSQGSRVVRTLLVLGRISGPNTGVWGSNPGPGNMPPSL